MLNEEKIKIMTKLALYEQGEGKKALKTNRFFKPDYVSLNMIYTAVLATISYFLLLLIWVIYKVDYFMQDIENIDLWNLGIIVFIIYILFMLFYIVLTYFIYSRRYKGIKKNLIEYNENLKQLHRSYKTDSKIKEEKGLGGSDKNVEPFDD